MQPFHCFTVNCSKGRCKLCSVRQPRRPVRSVLLHYLWSALSWNVPGHSGHSIKTCGVAMSRVQSVPELQVSLHFNSKVCIELERDPAVRCGRFVYHDKACSSCPSISSCLNLRTKCSC